MENEVTENEIKVQTKYWGKINHFPPSGRGGRGYPFVENSAKIINLIFEPFS